MKINSLVYLACVCLSLILFRCQTSSLNATQSVQKGDQANNQNQYGEAITHYENYLNNAPALGVYRNYQLESEVCRKLAHVYSTQGQYEKSIDYLNQALKLDKETNRDPLKTVEDLRLLGVTYSYQGKYQEAREFLEQSLSATEGMEASIKDQRRLTVADTYISKAHIELSMGNYQEADEMAGKALLIYEEVRDEPGQVESHLIKSHVLTARYELQKASGEIDRSLALARKNQLSTIRQLQAASEIQKLKGELEKSLETNLEAYEQAIRSNIRPQIIWATVRLGDAYHSLGDQKKANQFYREALILQQKSTGDSTNLLPSIKVRLGDLKEARNYWNRSGSVIGRGIASLRLGDDYLSQGKSDSAKFYYQQSEELFMSLRNVEGLARAKIGLSESLIGTENPQAILLLNEVLSITDQPEIKWQTWFQKGKAFESENALDSAFSSYSRSIEIIEALRGQITLEEFRSSFFANKTRVYDRLIRLVIEKGQQINQLEGRSFSEYAFHLNERSRSRTFLDMLGNKRIKPKSREDSTLLSREQLLKIKIQKLTLQAQKEKLAQGISDQFSEELGKSQLGYEEVIQKLKLSHPDYSSMISIEPQSLPQIQSLLDQETALLAYWVGEQNTIVWVVNQGELKHKVLDVTKERIGKQVQAVRNAIRFGLDEALNETLQSLYSQLVRPVNQWTNKTENLGIIPHGPLHFLPFQALIDEAGSYLIEKQNLFFSPSASVFHFTKQKRARENDQVLGLALGDHNIGDHNPLPGTEFEVDQISQFYRQYTPLVRNQNSETFLKRKAGDYGQIHIATHGVLSSEQPLYSYLLMAPGETDDGQLTVNEIMDLDLKSKLVTLSACETALGDMNDGDELVGLSRAFIYAGTPAVVVSLWTVDDLSTSLLMTKFHQFINEGNPAFVALSKAQRELLKESFSLSDSRGQPLQWSEQIKEAVIKENKYHRSPYYWAPFILIGSS